MSDAVVNSIEVASCWNASEQMVESAAGAWRSFKGAPKDKWFVLHHQPLAATRGVKHRKIYEATGLTWPLGEFLKKVPGPSTYLNDGCLSPTLPEETVSDQEIAEINRLFEYPAAGKRPEWKGPIPTLSCGTMNAKIFEAARTRIEKKAFRKAHVFPPPESGESPGTGGRPSAQPVADPGQLASPGTGGGSSAQPLATTGQLASSSKPTVSTPPENAGCASCSSTRNSPRSWPGLLMIVLFLIGVGRRRLPAQVQAPARGKQMVQLAVQKFHHDRSR
jgi:MYXO-CTERM domain-containing protein